jgi:hypothetical protein
MEGGHIEAQILAARMSESLSHSLSLHRTKLMLMGTPF